LDRAALAIEFSELSPLLANASIDFGLTGFEPAEIDSLLEDHVDREQDPADELPAPEKRPVTQRGDLWTRTHRLLCGDACCAADVTRLMARQRAAMIITDVPVQSEN